MVNRAFLEFIILVKIWKNKFDLQPFLERVDSIFIYYYVIMQRKSKDK